MTACRGIRGATTVTENDAQLIINATCELLEALKRENKFEPEDIASIFFSTTTDLDAVFPAKAARQLGWNQIAMLCSHEIPVPGSLPHCIRVLIHWNTDLRADEICHLYLHEAHVLRPDWAND